MLDLSQIPVVDPQTAKFLSRLCAHRAPLKIDLDGEQIAICLCDDPDLRVHTPDISLPISSALGAFVLHLEQRLVDRLSSVVLPGWENEYEDALPMIWRALTVADAIAAQTSIGVFDWCHDAVSKPANGQFAVTPATVHLKLEWREVQYPFLLEIITASDDETLHRVRPARPVDFSRALDVTVAPETALHGLTLSAEAAAAITVGDILLPRDAALPETPATIVIAGMFGWSGLLSDSGKFKFQKRLRKDQIMKDYSNVDVPHEAETGADDAFDPNMIAEAPALGDGEDASEVDAEPALSIPGLDDADLSAITVQLEVRLGSVPAPLSAFVDLAPGAVIDLGVDLSAPVEILGNGRVVGTGSLVQLESRIGVQIERWHKA